MARVTDSRGRPGDIVLVRGTQPISVWRKYGDPPQNADHAGTVMPGALGIIVSTGARAWTYVLWSTPMVLGWCQDGVLRRV